MNIYFILTYYEPSKSENVYVYNILQHCFEPFITVFSSYLKLKFVIDLPLLSQVVVSQFSLVLIFFLYVFSTSDLHPDRVDEEPEEDVDQADEEDVEEVK